MNPARPIAAVIVLAVVGGFYLHYTSEAASCGGGDTAASVLALMQKNGRINYIDDGWVGETTMPQFVSVGLQDVTALPAGSPFQCHAMIVVEYNPNYTKLMLEEMGKPYTGNEAHHREFSIDYTASRRGADRDVRINYQISEK